MPIPTLGAIGGADLFELIDSLEKQRKELQFILSSLDTNNVLELNAEVINAGRVKAKHIEVGSETTFQTGYDPAGIISSLDTRFSVLEGEITARVLQTDFDPLTQRVATAEASLSVLPGQIQSKVSTTDYNGNTVVSMINQTATTIKLKAENIQLDGITNVANELTIGNNFADGTLKAIRFRGTAGGVVISSSGVDTLAIGASYLSLSVTTLNIPSSATVNFNGATVNGLSAPLRFG